MYFDEIGLNSMDDLYCVIDSETTNSYIDEDGKLCLTDSLTYDISAIIINGKGVVIDKKKYICDEIFHSPLMKTAYFAEKIPEYVKAINNKEMKVASIIDIYYDFNKFVKKYNVKAIMAHNAKFDYRALNNTLRYLTGSKKRFFLPYGLPLWDTQRMARDTICKREDYIKYCKNNGYMTKHPTPKVRETAEILYRYLSGNNNFVEEHKGYEDILIEKEIFITSAKQYLQDRAA